MMGLRNLTVGSTSTVIALYGGLFIMVGSQEQGFSLISQTGIVYIVVQVILLFRKLLVKINKSL